MSERFLDQQELEDPKVGDKCLVPKLTSILHQEHDIELHGLSSTVAKLQRGVVPLNLNYLNHHTLLRRHTTL